MSLAMCYWIVLLLSLLLTFWMTWPISAANVKNQGPALILFVLLVLLGWQVFGSPLH